MQGGNINLGVGRIIPTLPEDACGAFLKPVLPLRNLVRMHIEVLRKLGKGFFALQSGQCHLGFKGRCVVPTWSPAHLLSSFRHFRRLGNRTSTYPAVRICETGSDRSSEKPPEATGQELRQRDNSASARLQSLDVLRGITVAAMI